MVHYSSRTSYCEGGAKNPLKGIPMKFLVCARNASFVCFQGVKKLGLLYNGIYKSPWFRGGLKINFKLNLC